MIILFLSEFGDYQRISSKEHIMVDTRPGAELKINFNLTFHALRCSEVHIDVMDVSGDQQLDVAHDTYRQRIDSQGRWVGKAFKEHTDGITTIQDELLEGCIIYGFLGVSKVQGNMHIALGSSSERSMKHIHQFKLQDLLIFNSSHTINYLAFGEIFPGIVNPLDGVARIVTQTAGAVHFQYFIKVVPTTYIDVSGRALETNQYSVTEQAMLVQPADIFSASQKIPGVFFFYDLSPFMVSVTNTRMSFSHFLTSVCAIIGGVCTIAGIIDSLLYHGSHLLKQKQKKQSHTGSD